MDINFKKFNIWYSARYFSPFSLRLRLNVKMQVLSFTEWRTHCAKIEPFSKILRPAKQCLHRSDFQSKVQHSASVLAEGQIFFTLWPSALPECENTALVIH